MEAKVRIMFFKITITTIILVFTNALQPYAQSRDTLHVHFLYGSKPKKEYRSTANKWFGGKLGGHVGVQLNHDQIIHFVPQGQFHYFNRKKRRNSKFSAASPQQFYQIFGTPKDSVKYLIVSIPITQVHRNQFENTTTAYIIQTPYDYAFFGMRCGAAARDILGKSGVLKDWALGKTWRRIFYPRKLRKKLIRRGRELDWSMEFQEGTQQRNWERDFPRFVDKKE